MDSETQGLITSAIIDAVILLILFILFTCYRKYRSKQISVSKDGGPPKNAAYDESTTSLGEIFGKVWRTSRGEFGALCGAESQTYIQLQYYMAMTILCATILSLAILVPCYLLADGDVDSDIELIGISSALEDDYYMIAPTAAFLINLGLQLYIIYLFVRSSQNKDNQQEIPINARTVQVWGIPKLGTAEELEEQVKQAFKTRFGDQIEKVVVIPEIAEYYAYSKQKEELSDQIQHWQEYKRVKGEAKTTRVKCKKRDMVEHLEGQVQEFSQKQDEVLAKHKAENSRFAFVLFNNPQNAENAVKNFVGTSELKSRYWHFQIAPTHKEINWHNLDVNQNTIKIKRCCLTTFFIFVFLIVLTPSQFVIFATQAMEDASIPDIIVGLIGSYLPTIFLVIYMSVILPMTIHWLVKTERYSNLTDETVSCLTKFLIFMIAHIFLAPTVGMQIFGTIQIIADSDYGSWQQEMGGRITISGLQLTIFILHVAFISNGFDLLQIGKLIGVKLKQRGAVNDVEKELAYQCPEFDFPYQYATGLTNFVIVLSYSVVFPVILIPGLLYFTLRYHIHKYILLCCFVNESKGSSKRISESIMNTLVVAMLFYSIITSLVIMLNGEIYYVTIGLFYLVGGILLSSILLCCSEFLLRSKKIGFDEELPLAQDDLAYTHPCEELHKNGNLTN